MIRIKFQFDIACAIDALSCVESGDPSVLNLISQTAYDLRIEDYSSSTSSNCSTSSFEDDENDEVVHDTSVQSDDEDDLDDGTFIFIARVVFDSFYLVFLWLI